MTEGGRADGRDSPREGGQRDEAIEGAAERRLLAGVLLGDEQAFRRLYRLHAHPLYLLALRMTGGVEADAEDIVQEAWRRAVRALPDFEGRAALRTWLASIVVRCALEQRRSTRAAGHPTDVEPGVRSGEARSWRRLDLERAFARLPPGFRAVLVLHDIEGYRHDDIAEMLGVSAGTSKSQLSRARARMRALLGEDYASE